MHFLRKLIYPILWTGSSGNTTLWKCFIYRFSSKLKVGDLKKITQTFGSGPSLLNDSVIPTKYTILNPSDVRLTGTLFLVGYSKLVSDYELQRLRNPESEEELELINNLPESTKTIRFQIEHSNDSA